MTAAWNLLDGTTNNISLLHKWTATAVTDFVMTNQRNSSYEQVLTDIYQITHFYSFFDGMRQMVQDYLLGGSFIERKVLFGYDEPRFKHIFENQTDVADDFFEVDRKSVV